MPLCAVIDIEGAIDNTSFGSIKDTYIPTTVNILMIVPLGWIQSIIKSKLTFTNIGDPIAKAMIARDASREACSYFIHPQSSGTKKYSYSNI